MEEKSKNLFKTKTVMTKRLVFLFLSWRILLLLPLIASEAFLKPRINYEYTLLPYFLEKGSLLTNFLLYPFGNFDGAYYLLIAVQGYTVNAGFFPLFPLSIRLVTFILNSPSGTINLIQYLVGIFLVSVYFILSLFLLYRIIKFDYKENVAMSSIYFLLIFPTSFFFASVYSESLFLLLSLLVFYLARSKKWFLAGIMGALLSATRLVGIVILPSLLYEYFKEEKNRTTKKLLSILIVPLGIGSYVLYNFIKWGDPLNFIKAQGNFANNRTVDSIVLIPQTFFRYVKILFSIGPNSYEWWVAVFELFFIIFAATLLYLGWKKKIRFSYLLFGALCFIIPASSGTFSGMPRYISVIFPIFIALSLIKRKLFKIAYSIISIILLFIFFMLFSKGYFVA